MSEDEKPVVLKEAESGRIKIVVEKQKRLMFNCDSELFHIEKCVDLERAHIIYTVPDTLCGSLHEQHLWLSIKELLDVEDALDRLIRIESREEGSLVKEVTWGRIHVSIFRNEYNLRTVAGYTGYQEKLVEVECANIEYSIEEFAGRLSHRQSMRLNAEELADVKSAIEQLGIRNEGPPP